MLVQPLPSPVPCGSQALMHGLCSGTPNGWLGAGALSQVSGLRSLRLRLPDVKPVAEYCGCQFVFLGGLMAFPSEDTFSLVCSGINEIGLLVLRMIDRDLRHPQNACHQFIDLETPPSEEWHCVPETFFFFAF